MPDLRRLILLSVISVLASLAVPASALAADFFSNPAPIAITAGFAPAAPYPSEIPVSGLVGPISDVNVTLFKVGHTNPDDLDVLLVSPSGDKVMLMSDACGEDDIEDFTWTFNQQAPRAMSDDSADCGESVYRPTDYPGTGQESPTESMFSPAPPRPYGISLASFNNKSPNGTWKLYVQDDFALPASPGDMELGWALGIETGPVDVAIPATGTSGPASPYPATRTVSGETGLISDLNVSIDGIWHERPDDLDMLLVGPEGQKVVLMSDACGSLDVSAYGWEWDDEAAAPMPEGNGTDVCGTRFHKPANYGSGDVWPAPAPDGPHATALSAFDGTDPNGEWRLFVNDDADGNKGFFTNRFQLGITTVPRPDTTAPDTTAPDTTINSGPSGFVRSTSATFGFSSSEADSTFRCSLDGAAFAGCSSPKSYAGLANTHHTFRVQAADQTGNIDPTPALRVWTVDTRKPAISRPSPKPGASTRDRTPTIRATVRDNLTNLSKGNIKLYVDGKRKTSFLYNVSRDSLTYTTGRLAYKRHTVRVVVSDQAGNVEARSWRFSVNKG
jgi:subtilisin-like proprotein convertase family protein